MVISIDRRYEVVQTTGEVIPAEILTINARGTYPVLARMHRGGSSVIQRFTSHGIAELGYGFSHLQEIPRYKDWPMDAEVIVYDHPKDVKLKRHFAGVDDYGRPRAWADGKTSWSTDDHDTVPWKYAELCEKEQ